MQLYKFLVCIWYYWPEDDPLRSKRVAKLKIQHLLVVLTVVLFLLLLYLTQRDDKPKNRKKAVRTFGNTGTKVVILYIPIYIGLSHFISHN
jgi:hypothetical protein